ncbi:MAG: HAD-IA family hydrolase [bacterium]
MNKYVLFDFDGVIADSLNNGYIAQKVTCPNITIDNYQNFFTGNINDFEKHSVHDDKCNHEIDYFIEYGRGLLNDVKVFPGMTDALKNLSEKYKMVVISSTKTDLIRDFMTKHNIRHFFGEILGNDVHKSKVEKIKMVMVNNDLKQEDCLFITDTLGDLIEAEKAGVGSIAVTWGFHSEDFLLKGNYYKILDEVADLEPTVDNYFKR